MQNDWSGFSEVNCVPHTCSTFVQALSSFKEKLDALFKPLAEANRLLSLKALADKNKFDRKSGPFSNGDDFPRSSASTGNWMIHHLREPESCFNRPPSPNLAVIPANHWLVAARPVQEAASPEIGVFSSLSRQPGRVGGKSTDDVG